MVLRVVLRWLLPLVAALVLVGQSLTAWAAAGRFGGDECCCPQPKKCKCHDHGGGSNTPELRLCSSDARLVAPAPLVATPPSVPVLPCDVVVALPLPPPLPAAPADRFEPPEPPPF